MENWGFPANFSWMTVVAAMGQMFYSLSIAMGILITFGSYMKKDVSIEGSTKNVEIFDTAIAIMAGLMIIPAVFAFSGGDPDTLQAGPSLMFITLPKVFDSMGMGTFVGIMFFVLVLFAAMTSSIALTESAVSTFEDELGWGRKKSTVIMGVIMLALGTLSSLGYGPLGAVKIIGMLQGNFGYSQIYKTNVSNVLPARMLNTIYINIFSTLVALAITIPLGIYCAVHKRSKSDNAVQVLSIVGYSIPVYIIALLFIWLFAVTLKLLPVFGMQTPGNNFTGFRAFLDKVYYMTLPVLVMTVGSLGGMTRYVRAAMIEALSMDYIRTARAKGLREKVVVYSHAWRNALLPVITVLIGWFISIFSGSLIIEQMFALNGMGQLYYQGLMNNDFELALAIQMFYVLIALVGQLITDLSYGIVDPRVRVNK